MSESVSPTDLLATALVTCMLTLMGIAARKHGWKLDGARVMLRGILEPPELAQAIGELLVDVG